MSICPSTSVSSPQQRDNRPRKKTFKYPDAVIHDAVALINQGSTWTEAAASIGMSRDALYQRVRKMGLEVRRGSRPYLRPSQIQVPTGEDLGYLAGILDGEGHISIESKAAGCARNCVHVGVTNTDETLLAWLETIGGHVSWRVNKPNLGSKPCGVWQLVARQDVLALLRAVRPHMRIKQDRAQAGIEQIENLLAQS